MKRRHFLATAALALPACRRATIIPPPPANNTARRLAIPAQGLYTGAYMEFGDREDQVTLEKIEGFESLVGKHQAIVASSSYWGEQTFPARNLGIISRHDAIPLVFWSPWDRPYIEGRGPDKYSITSIIEGAHDAYIDKWADGARELNYPIIVSFANEMNGSWFPWSGVHYGAGKPIPDTNPPQYEGPTAFKRAWRHIVDRVRARGATNVLWVLHLMDYSDPQEEWNLARHYYPGPDYVDWLGFSLYGMQFPVDEEWAPFLPLFDWPYTELTLFDSTKPIMLCEWGVGDFPKKGDKGGWIRDAFRIMQDPKYPRLKAAVFWHDRWENSADPDHPEFAVNAGKFSDLRVNSSPGSLKAYQESVAPPYFLSAPQWAP